MSWFVPAAAAAGTATAATTAAAVGTGLTAGATGFGLTAAGAGLGLTASTSAFAGVGASAAAGAGSLFTAANLGLLSSAISVGSSLYQGKQQAIAYRIQAMQASLKGRQEALNYNRRAFDTLERNRRLNASLNARAAAGGIDPFSGSPLTLADANNIAAYEEATIDRDNAEMAIYGGLAQSQSLQAAAATSQTFGYLTAAAKGASGAASFMDTRTPKGT